MNEYVDNEARKSRLVGKTVTMAHGAGGRQTSELIDMIFKAHFDNPDLTADDAAVLTPPICDSEWRGLGIIPGSGLRLRDEWDMYDARKKYQVPKMEGRANPACRCGDVLQGKCKPSDCKVFGKVCTPQHPVGACMVSGEGACSAYYMYGRE